MLSALAQRLLSGSWRHDVLPRAASISKSMFISQSRSLVGIPPATEERKKQYQPPEMRKDVTWNLLADYSQRRAAPTKTAEQIWQDRSNRLGTNPPPSVYYGRSVIVHPDKITLALKALSNRLRGNKVLQTWKYQMRHEKKGVKRRRLVSQRWRRRFAHEVRRKIVLVQSIQRRGQ
ncbi:hypothetical protein PILCRDRAFT_4277 [Piloderma croceum F 1598]|uniref:Ribosomal protein S21 n=1 Tax=Piloderma croceum (strain F 1598) TaxID=765440 RepID=A0A0C3BKS8_PILCF|nr:hypothetical protein PILCRDRAFT_4277 [Piloderma croceum F 1598]